MKFQQGKTVQVEQSNHTTSGCFDFQDFPCDNDEVFYYSKCVPLCAQVALCDKPGQRKVQMFVGEKEETSIIDRAPHPHRGLWGECVNK